MSFRTYGNFVYFARRVLTEGIKFVCRKVDVNMYERVGDVFLLPTCLYWYTYTYLIKTYKNETCEMNRCYSMY